MFKRLGFIVLVSIIVFVGCGKKNPNDNGNGDGDGWVNNSPYTPSYPSPYDGESGVSTTATLSWTGGDPDEHSIVKYTVYFGTSSTPPLVSSDQSNTTYNPGTMAGATTYYWRVMAKDDSGATATSDVWSFETYGAHRSEWTWSNTDWSVSPGNYSYLGPYSLEAGDSLDIAVTNVSSNTAHLFCMTSTNFANWQAGNTAYSIFSVDGSTGGTWKRYVPSTDSYYFVDDNGGSIITTVTFHLKVDVIRWEYYKK